MKRLQIVFLSLLIFGCATTEKLRQTTQQIKVDGISDDWPQLVHYNKDLGIIYGVTYDNSHLYVIAKTYEENAKRKILSSGLTIWINPNGKKKKVFGVKYPIMQGASRNGNREPSAGREKSLNMGELNKVMLQGLFSDNLQIVQKSDLKIDLDVMIKLDSLQDLVYEFKVPLALLKQKSKSDLEKIAIGFELNETERPTQGNRTADGGGGGQGSGMSRGGGASRSGGRPSGGQRGGGASSGQSGTNTSQSQVFWYKVAL